MSRIFLLILLSIQLTAFAKDKVEKYYGKVTSIMGNYEGFFHINLNGENSDMVEIELGTTKEKKKRSTYTETRSVRLNVAAIRTLTIDNIEYIIRDIEYEANKFYKNCCMVNELTSKNANLYRFNYNNTLMYAMLNTKSKEAKWLNMVSVFSVMVVFKECESLRAKIGKKEVGYVLTEGLGEEERFALWKRWFLEFNECIKTE